MKLDLNLFYSRLPKKLKKPISHEIAHLIRYLISKKLVGLLRTLLGFLEWRMNKEWKKLKKNTAQLSETI